mmetsp:Transcript_40555/g.67006  ORF Transcript_40555/g.67006 Transcript_40555/m.67006 type:complete len:115 (+) Transcript_40555:2-346(+)
MSESYGGESPQEGRRQQLRRMAIIHDLLTGRGERGERGDRMARDDESEEIEAEADEDTPERAALAEDLDAADADGSSEEAEESAAIVTDSCEDVSGEECEDGAPPTGAVQDRGS